ncbi:hypothetical protein HMPREF1210_01599 [Paenisporosarcina sp. HGH0030]|nr:hypothetical protein HMPREF1210_01599 [Paenisporosarcina sp. HGH0030]
MRVFRVCGRLFFDGTRTESVEARIEREKPRIEESTPRIDHSKPRIKKPLPIGSGQ